MPGWCGKPMTEPDDGLEDALRRALSAAADEVAPGTDGLSKIRAKIGNRPPRPWLLSVLAGRAERVRNWTWHWSPPLRWPAAFPAPRGRLAPRPGLAGAGLAGAGLAGARGAGVRLGAVLAGIAAIAAISLGVQPFRHAIIMASSTVFDGGSPAPDSGGGTESNGTHTLGSSVANFATTRAPGRGAASIVPDVARSAAAKSTQAQTCGAATAEATPSAVRSTDDGSTAALTQAPTTPSAQSTDPAGASGSASPGDSGTVEATCRVSTPTVSPTVSPTPSVSSTASTPLVSDPTPESTPTPTPTATWTTADPSPVYTWQTPTPSWTRPTHEPRQHQQSGAQRRRLRAG